MASMTGEDSTADIDVHEEENYFISLTDLMTGVVFIFAILLAMTATTFYSAQVKLKNEQNRALEAEKRAMETEKKVESLDRALKDNGLKVEQIDALAKVLKQREEVRRRMLENLSSRLNTRGVTVSFDPGSGIIRLR